MQPSLQHKPAHQAEDDSSRDKAEAAQHVGALQQSLRHAGEASAQVFRLIGAGAERQAAQIAEAAAPRTTTLSAAYLRAAARGECSAYWHSTFEALLKADAAAWLQRNRKYARVHEASLDHPIGLGERPLDLS